MSLKRDQLELCFSIYSKGHICLKSSQVILGLLASIQSNLYSHDFFSSHTNFCSNSVHTSREGFGKTVWIDSLV